MLTPSAAAGTGVQPGFSSTTQSERFRGLFALVVSLGLLAVLAADGLFAPFTPDDIMNLHEYWQKPLWGHLRDVVAFHRGAFRPAGAAFYLPLFAVFGLNPLPFHAVCLGLLAVNLVLAFAVVHELTRSALLAGLVAVLFAYHAHFADLYYLSATIYDLQAFFLSYLCFYFYLRIRKRGEVPNARQSAGLAALGWLALCTKEHAASLPAVLLAYEIVYRDAWRLARHSWWRWLAGPGRLIAILGILSAAYLAPRVLGPATMASNPAYRLQFTLPVYAGNLRHHLEHLLYVEGVFPAPFFLALGAAALGLALIGRSRILLFAWLLFFLTSLPVMFLPDRGQFVVYISHLGLVLFLAGALRLVVRRLFPLRSFPDAFFFTAVLALAALLYVQHSRVKPRTMGAIALEQAKARRLMDAVSRLPRPSPGARILVANSPFAEDDWTPILLLRLYFREHNLWGTSVPGTDAPAGSEPFDAVMVLPE